MRAAVLHAPGDLRVENIPAPNSLADHEALVRVFACGICGSDIGRVMVTGTYSFPTVPGHEFSGIVELTGNEVGCLTPGDRVAVAPLLPCYGCPECAVGRYSLCDDYGFLGSRTNGAFAEYVRVPARNAVKIPDCVSLEAAATIEPAAIVLHGMQKVDIGLGISVAVIGCGSLGYFAIQFAKLSGAGPIIAIDVDDGKLALAEEVGADLCVNPTKDDAVALARSATGDRGVGLSIECAGNRPGRDTAIQLAKKHGMILFYGTANSDVVLPKAIFEKIIRHELQLVGSWNSYSAPFPGKEWTDIIELLRTRQLVVDPLISHRLPIDATPAIFDALHERTFEPYHKILVVPNNT